MRPNAWFLLMLVFICLAPSSVRTQESSSSLEKLLETRIPDYEQATGIPGLRPGPVGTVASKFLRLQETVEKITKKRLPIYIDPAAAVRVVPGREEERLGAPLTNVSLEDVIKLMCVQMDLRYELIPGGILISEQVE